MVLFFGDHLNFSPIFFVCLIGSGIELALISFEAPKSFSILTLSIFIPKKGFQL